MSGFCNVGAIVSGVRGMEAAPRSFLSNLLDQEALLVMRMDDTANVAKANASRLIIPRNPVQTCQAKERGMNLHHIPLPHDLSLYRHETSLHAWTTNEQQ